MGGLATTLVVDDRADVWNAIPNLIQIEPYRRFWRSDDPEAAGMRLSPADDRNLLHVAEKLRMVHRRFYELVDAGQHADVRDVVTTLRLRVLSGTTIAFSGVIPL